MRKPVSARRQKQTKNQSELLGQEKIAELEQTTACKSNLDKVIVQPTQSIEEILQSVQDSQKLLLEKIESLLLVRQVTDENFKEIRKNQLSLDQSLVSLQRETAVLKQMQSSVFQEALNDIKSFEKLTKHYFSILEKNLNETFASYAENQKIIHANLNSINSNILTHIPYLFKQELLEVKNILLGSKSEKDLERTISFQLGKEIIGSVKNLKEIISLPQRLKELKNENLKRKKINSAPIINQENNLKNRQVAELALPKILGDLELKKDNSDESSDTMSSDHRLAPKALKNKKIKILSVLESATFESLSRNSDLNYLLEANEKQVAGTTSDLFMVESAYATFKNIWDYSTFSNNPKHPKTQKLLDSLNRINLKKIPTVFLDRTTVNTSDNFQLIRNKADVVLCCSDQVQKKNSHLKNVTKIQNFYNEYIFNPNEFEIKKSGGIAFFGEFNSNHSALNEEFKPCLNELSKNSVSIFQGVAVDNPVYDGLENIKKIDVLNSKLLAETIKKHDVVFYAADKNEDFASEQLLSYLASYRPVISTRNKFLENEFKDIITFLERPSELKRTIHLLKDHRWISQRKSHLGYRLVNNKYTSKNLINQISDIFVKDNPSEEKPLISILMATMREEYIDRIVLNLTRQSYSNKEIIIMTQNWSNDGVQKLQNLLEQSKQFNKVVVLSDNSEITLGQRLNKCFTHASKKSEYVAKMDDDDFYFPNYLSDMMIPFSFGNYAVVGKWEYFIYLEETNKVVLIRDGRGSNRESDMVAGATLLIKKSIFEKFNGFKSTNNGEDSDLLKRIQESKLKIYSCDPFNLVVFRSKDMNNHTFRVKAEVFEKSCTFICNGIDESIVTI